MAAKSLRQQLVEAVDTRLKTILTTGGYETNVGGNVFWWRSRLDQAGLPAIVCLDRQHQEWAATASWRRTLIIDLEIYLAPAGAPDTAMRQALADIETAIGSDVTCGGLAEDTSFFEGEHMSLDDHESIVVASGFFITIEYTTEPWNPRS